MSAQPAGWQEALRLGHSLQDQGRFLEAEAAFHSALRELEQVPALAAIQATAAYDLATVKVDLGRADEAARLFERAISILTKTAAPGDPQLQTVRIELAGLYADSGQVSTAERLLKQVVGAQSKTGAVTSLQGARALDALAGLYAQRKKLAAAEHAERQALSYLETLQNSGELSLAAASRGMSMILDASHRAREALPYAQRAAALFEQLPNAEPFLPAETRMSLASLYVSLGRPDEAEAESREAVDRVERVYGPDHSHTGWMMLARAAILRRLNRKEEAQAPQQQGNRIIAAQQKLNRLGDTVPASTLMPAP